MTARLYFTRTENEPSGNWDQTIAVSPALAACGHAECKPVDCAEGAIIEVKETEGAAIHRFEVRSIISFRYTVNEVRS